MFGLMRLYDYRYERMSDDIQIDTLPSITPSTTNHATENTPLRRLPESNQPSVAPDANVGGKNTSDESHLVEKSIPVDVAAGALKQCVIDSSFGDSVIILRIARRSHGTVPKWILSVAMATGFIAMVIGYFGGVGTSVPATVGLAIFAFLSILSLSSLLLFQQDTSITSFKVRNSLQSLCKIHV